MFEQDNIIEEEKKVVPQDESVFKCKSCDNQIKRVFYGDYYPNGKDKRWIDESTGKQCNGMLCSSCHTVRAVKYSKLRYRRKKREAKLAKRNEEQHKQDVE